MLIFVHKMEPWSLQSKVTQGLSDFIRASCVFFKPPGPFLPQSFSLALPSAQKVLFSGTCCMTSSYRPGNNGEIK